MKRVFCNIFALHPHELKKVFSFVVLAFLWSLAASLGQRSSDIIFLIKIGSNALPSVYIQTSLAVIIFSGALLYGYHHFNGKSVFYIMTAIGITFYSFIAIFLISLESPPKWVWYLLRIFSSLFLYSMITTFWSFINCYFHISEAKRLFGLFTSVVFLGSAFSGLILKTGRFNMQEIIGIVVLLLIPVVCMIFLLSRTQVNHEDEQFSNNDLNSYSGVYTVKNVLKHIFSSRLVSLIIFAHFLAFFLWVVAEYNYMSAFEKHFINRATSPMQGIADSELTIFMGKCITITSIINLIFGIFIYSRVIKYFGVGTAILFTPLLYLAAFSGWIFNNSLFFPVMGFFIVEGTCEITDDSNFNLLIKNLHPRINSFLRVIVDMIFEPLGMLFGGFMLSVPNINSKILGVALALSAVVVAYVIKKYYSYENTIPDHIPVPAIRSCPHEA